jgi:hypothetical protein
MWKNALRLDAGGQGDTIYGMYDTNPSAMNLIKLCVGAERVEDLLD